MPFCNLEIDLDLRPKVNKFKGIAIKLFKFYFLSDLELLKAGNIIKSHKGLKIYMSRGNLHDLLA